MKITLRELRQLVQIELLEEGVIDLANKLTTKFGIVNHADDGTDTIIVIAAHKTEGYDFRKNDTDNETVVLPKVVGTISAESYSKIPGAMQVTSFYADSAQIAIMLLAAGLEKWRKVVPDSSVSPSAKAVIKRYYDQNVNDPTKVMITGLDERDEYLDSIYLGPVGFDIQSAYELGNRIVKNTIDKSNYLISNKKNVIDSFLRVSTRGFVTAYNDRKKTGNTYDNMLKSNHISALISAIDNDIDENKHEVFVWLKKNYRKLIEKLDDNPGFRSHWDEYIESKVRPFLDT